MAIYPALIDARPAYLKGNGAPRSLLLTPMSTRTLLGCAYEHVVAATDEALTILTSFAVDPEYDARVRSAGALIDDVISIDDIDEMLDRLEPSDWLLVVDPRCFPMEGAGLRELVRESAESRGAHHLVAMERSRQGTKEYVQLDAQGQVRRIQRYYDGVTWLRTRAVVASLIPVSAAREVSNAALRDLTMLRKSLITGGVISRDIDLQTGVFDLNQEHGLLQLCEYYLSNLTSRTPPPEYDVPVPGVWVGPRCRVDSTARLYGPVILQEGVRVDKNATLIGPVLVGAGSQVRQNTLLAQCLVAPGVVVPKQTTSQRRVLCGENGSGPVPKNEPSPESLTDNLPEHFHVVSSNHSVRERDGKWRRKTYIAVKRVGEGVAALLGLIVLSPLMLLTAVVIKLTSRGPVFFYHEREGKDGKPFRCCKYRTMVSDAHRQQRALYRENAVDGPQFELHDDPRITWLGQRLRLTNIDELPQLFHVVLGQMSLIGPRPSPFRENQICIPWREARLAVRPGITGLWQLCRHDRSAGDFHQWIHYDMLYVRHLSVWLDLKIMLATLLTLAGRWTVPVTWLIPANRLRKAHERPVTRPPTLRSQHISRMGGRPDRDGKNWAVKTSGERDHASNDRPVSRRRTGADLERGDVSAKSAR